MGDRPDAGPAEPARGEILPPARPDATAARSLVGRLVRGGGMGPFHPCTTLWA